MKFLQGFLELIFPTPRICPFCQEDQEELEACSLCLEELQKIKEDLGQCTRCGTFGIKGSICANCYQWPEYYQRNLAVLPYQGKWRQSIHQLKFKNQGWLAAPLAEMMASLIGEETFDLVIPVPLHPERLRARGFNQGALLGQKVAQIHAIEYQDELLIRTVYTEYQSGLNLKKRAGNVKNAFILKNNSIVKGKRILLIDDLMTSGATLRECSKILYLGGAKTVTSLTLGAGIK